MVHSFLPEELRRNNILFVCSPLKLSACLCIFVFLFLFFPDKLDNRETESRVWASQRARRAANDATAEEQRILPFKFSRQENESSHHPLSIDMDTTRPPEIDVVTLHNTCTLSGFSICLLQLLQQYIIIIIIKILYLLHLVAKRRRAMTTTIGDSDNVDCCFLFLLSPRSTHRVSSCCSSLPFSFTFACASTLPTNRLLFISTKCSTGFSLSLIIHTHTLVSLHIHYN